MRPPACPTSSGWACAPRCRPGRSRSSTEKGSSASARGGGELARDARTLQILTPEPSQSRAKVPPPSVRRPSAGAQCSQRRQQQGEDALELKACPHAFGFARSSIWQPDPPLLGPQLVDCRGRAATSQRCHRAHLRRRATYERCPREGCHGGRPRVSQGRSSFRGGGSSAHRPGSSGSSPRPCG